MLEPDANMWGSPRPERSGLKAGRGQGCPPRHSPEGRR